MNVSLTPELEQFVQEKVKIGRYPSASEVVREALRLLEERDRIQQIKLETLRKEIMVGVEQIERGDIVDGEAVFAELEEDIRQIEQAGA
ncbi:CopG family transcriptional regulator [Scytonema hofmannii PCC 7110]|uniref:CopG family transcriptional regulator n=1 Tax=Scytonema hofmannii PCC 7110 TaxID=128403 RepID=A0A139XG60_9CYAN|nr:type II toxin-antitoxin system ParD family antitoxin [Scytonema hofmannii]KYC43612.1 CopG family transcriptional regulator [Scytonema hofmannii PCC 7110]